MNDVSEHQLADARREIETLREDNERLKADNTRLLLEQSNLILLRRDHEIRKEKLEQYYLLQIKMNNDNGPHGGGNIGHGLLLKAAHEALLHFEQNADKLLRGE